MTDGIDGLARLAGIDLDPDERELLVRHLEALQQLIDALPAVVDDESAPQAVELTLRADDPGDALDPGTVADLMPRRHGPWLELPPVRGDQS